MQEFYFVAELATAAPYSRQPFVGIIHSGVYYKIEAEVCCFGLKGGNSVSEVSSSAAAADLASG